MPPKKKKKVCLIKGETPRNNRPIYIDRPVITDQKSSNDSESTEEHCNGNDD
ncbi:TPA: hypothetical protein QC415_003819 [Bacillus cereus]|nr:hypothetical protein [Bacillus thuringiensis]HDR8474864.1 hypothetical protein [Bacillus cereus]